MRSYTIGLMVIPDQACPAGEAVSMLVALYPTLQPHLRDLRDLPIPLKSGNILPLVPAVAGG